jgi:hypothetical protein
MREIQLRDAKSNLSAVVDEAMQGKQKPCAPYGSRNARIRGQDFFDLQISAVCPMKTIEWE